MNLENLQLSEEPGASPDVHLAGRFKVPEGYVLIKQEPGSELLLWIKNLITARTDSDGISEKGLLDIYKAITCYAPKHNQD